VNRAPVTTAVAFSCDRHTPPAVFAQAAAAAAQSGVVDELLVWDQMTNFWPRQLWCPQNSPMATIVPDLDSYSDAFAMSAYMAASAPGVGMTISTDAIRRGPAELTQTMMTLANLTEGRAKVMIGAGEAKQVTPYGWKRSEGLARLEDQLKAFHTLWNSAGPVDLQGNHWTFKQAWLGQSRTHRPRVWALGGGPKLFDLATTYADGISAIVPSVAPNPQAWAETVASMKAGLAQKGRDPERFDFGIWFMSLVHEDDDLLQRALDNPLMRWMAGVFGRLDQSAWDAEGIEPPLPRDWHYAMKLLPVKWSDSEIEELLGRTTHEMAEKSFVYGTPESVTEQVQQYIDAGATWVSVCDILPLILDPEDAQAGLARNIDICRRLKGRTPRTTGESRSVVSSSAP
jgi:phthiodiolone/phenolphthiodiolone dimycocerosates ketoreductase